MKKVEAVIDPAALDAVKLHLADAGIDGRLTVTAVNGIESLGRFYELRTTSQDQWKPCLKIDLIVSDRQAEPTVNIILQHANLVGSGGSGGHISILTLDATLEIGAESPKPPSKDRRFSKRSPALAGGLTQEGLRSESGQQTPQNHYQRHRKAAQNSIRVTTFPAPIAP
jgi:nitrogen regulatory protein PII